MPDEGSLVGSFVGQSSTARGLAGEYSHDPNCCTHNSLARVALNGSTKLDDCGVK